jgi:hypothetical protein
VHLKPDKTFRMCFEHLFINQILDLVAVHPRLNPRAPCNDAHSIPAFIVQIVMPILNFILGGKPPGAKSFAVN